MLSPLLAFPHARSAHVTHAHVRKAFAYPNSKKRHGIYYERSE
jgi:hypothetical protein